MSPIDPGTLGRVKRLCARTGASIQAAARALEHAHGDVDVAARALQEGRRVVSDRARKKTPTGRPRQGRRHLGAVSDVEWDVLTEAVRLWARLLKIEGPIALVRVLDRQRRVVQRQYRARKGGA